MVIYVNTPVTFELQTVIHAPVQKCVKICLLLWDDSNRVPSLSILMQFIKSFSVTEWQRSCARKWDLIFQGGVRSQQPTTGSGENSRQNGGAGSSEWPYITQAPAKLPVTKERATKRNPLLQHSLLFFIGNEGSIYMACWLTYVAFWGRRGFVITKWDVVVWSTGTEEPIFPLGWNRK